jgi:hypothetical protein
MKKTKIHKDVEIINCTPHDIVFVVENHIDDEFYAIEKFIIKKSGIVPRLKEVERKIDTFKINVTRERDVETDGCDNGWHLYVDIMEKSFSEVEGLPEPKENTYYIVSALVAGACKNRDDLVVPNDTVRDDQGRIIGCRSLAKI